MENKRRLRLRYYGIFGLFGLFGFVDPLYFLFFLFFLFFLAPDQKSQNKVDSMIEEQEHEKLERKQRIVEFLVDKDNITNDDVQKLLGVSDATAERYLNELEKEGKLKQMGGEQKDTYYSKL